MNTYTERMHAYHTELNERDLNEKRRRNKRKKLIRKAQMRAVKSTLVLVVAIVAIVATFTHFTKNWECYDSVARKQLMLDINKGDKEAIAFYRDNYINRDIYLFDGNFTLEMMANRHGLDVETLKESYEESGYTHIQDFFDNEIEDQLFS